MRPPTRGASSGAAQPGSHKTFFVKGGKRPPGGGRKPGTKNKWCKSVRAALDRIATLDASLMYDALKKGLQADPPHSAPYVKMVFDRVLGPIPDGPVDERPALYFLTLKGDIGKYDPLAASDRGEVPEVVEVAARKALTAKPATPPPSPPPPRRPAPPAPPVVVIEESGIVEDPAETYRPARRKK